MVMISCSSEPQENAEETENVASAQAGATGSILDTQLLDLSLGNLASN